MANILGKTFTVHIFGQSHADDIGAVIEGLPAGFVPDWEKVHAFMKRRAPGASPLATGRKESDTPIILSGFNEHGTACGAPLAMRISNGDHHSADYESLRAVPRPGHADFAAHMKYSGENDVRGGGQFSGRLTAPLCFAGALAMQLLEQNGIRTKAHILSIADVKDRLPDPLAPDIDSISDGILPTYSWEAAQSMEEAIISSKEKGDSVGGIIECFVTGLPAGLGDPMFDGMENQLARAIFAIPGVKGVEFGSGFSATQMTGSTHNDAFCLCDGNVRTKTNHHGGILGGITTGMPLVVRMAVKPTPSIAAMQDSVNLVSKENTMLSVSGRHDPCIVPRAVPVMEAVIACVIYDIMKSEGKIK